MSEIDKIIYHPVTHACEPLQDEGEKLRSYINDWIVKVIIMKLYTVLKMINIEYIVKFVINFV